MRVGVRVWSATASGSERPVTRPSLADRYCTSPAITLASDDDPHQQEAVLRAGADVGGDVAGIDVGDGGDERRAEQQPARTQPRLGVAQQLTHFLSGLSNRKVRLAETAVQRVARPGSPAEAPAAEADDRAAASTAVVVVRRR